MPFEEPFRIDEAGTRDRLEAMRALQRELSPPEAARRLVRTLGAHPVHGGAHFGFWLPDVPADAPLDLELFQPEEHVDFAAEQRVRFTRRRLPVARDGAWGVLAVDGARAGTRERCGTLYRLRLSSEDGGSVLRGDPMAASLPFGLHGPAELYDVALMHQQRDDRAYFRHVALGASDEPPRIEPPGPVLEVHVGTATHGGTLGDLADLYRTLAARIRAGEALTPAERCFLGFDALQLLPVEPMAEARADAPRFEPDEGDAAEAEVTATLRPVGSFGWGFDAPVYGAAAVDPALLRSARPDELVDLACALHTFPGKPMALFLDMSVGHAHAQGVPLLPDAFFAGPGPFGQDLAFDHPIVRATLLELQRRKADFGADGLRIGGSRAVRVWSDVAGGMVLDEALLRDMGEVVQEVAEVRYRTRLVFEEGTLSDEAPGALSWSPVAAPGRSPVDASFWRDAWARLEASAHDDGARRVRGYADHAAMRAAYRRTPQAEPGGPAPADLPEVSRRAFDLPAAAVVLHAALPGVPLDFVAAGMRAPWAFMRDTDVDDALRVLADEAGFFVWRGDPERYRREGAFPRAKAWGFEAPASLAAFLSGVAEVVAEGETEPEAVAAGAEARGVPAPFPLDAGALRDVARAVMEDLHEYCVVWRFEDELDEAQVEFDLALRRFRRDRPWLRRDLRGSERLERRLREDGGMLAVGVRIAPDGGEEVASLANLASGAWEVVPADLLGDAAGWEPAVLAPGLAWSAADAGLTLLPGSGLVVVRRA